MNQPRPNLKLDFSSFINTSKDSLSRNVKEFSGLIDDSFNYIHENTTKNNNKNSKDSNDDNDDNDDNNNNNDNDNENSDTSLIESELYNILNFDSPDSQLDNSYNIINNDFKIFSSFPSTKSPNSYSSIYSSVTNNSQKNINSNNNINQRKHSHSNSLSTSLSNSLKDSFSLKRKSIKQTKSTTSISSSKSIPSTKSTKSYTSDESNTNYSIFSNNTIVNSDTNKTNNSNEEKPSPSKFKKSLKRATLIYSSKQKSSSSLKLKKNIDINIIDNNNNNITNFNNFYNNSNENKITKNNENVDSLNNLLKNKSFAKFPIQVSRMEDTLIIDDFIIDYNIKNLKKTNKTIKSDSKLEFNKNNQVITISKYPSNEELLDTIKRNMGLSTNNIFCMN
ncbi:uncharacterized protein ASCRUDRAFT_11155 [Ascoidea rubescens DSM 1968]|uniref:Uncharacterized protein n=1 Tax=Ascoidea rubescens DSM 1968 TaxID=1344418 RepID=A0A1D2VQ87_9ASCO|nr:hypothetical protein ASCRUDRAFT_11155 [Ascoidea rubescens DSM 1968]ODV63707.1 hypothetical protein ASCRUDRAFT_11155 [Ascoidea rubescens DSM 1968]